MVVNVNEEFFSKVLLYLAYENIIRWCEYSIRPQGG